MHDNLFHILAIDMGGTNSRFAHFILQNGALQLEHVHHCPTHSLHSVQDALIQSAYSGLDPTQAHIQVWAVAGPVFRPLCVRLTNAPIFFDLRPLQQQGQCVHLLNDFVAQAWATLSIPGQQATVLRPCTMQENTSTMPRAVIGAGTGLGMATLLPQKNGLWCVRASEAGHEPFPFADTEKDYAAFLRNQYQTDVVSAEHVVSGRGLELLHQFLTDEMLAAHEISSRYLHATHPHETEKCFAYYYGKICAQWAVQTQCKGGLFISGGIAVKNPRLLSLPEFGEGLLRVAPDQTQWISAMPVSFMQREDTGLWGAAYAGQQILNFSE